MKKILSLILLTSALSDVSFSMNNIYESPHKATKRRAGIENINYLNQDLQSVLSKVNAAIARHQSFLSTVNAETSDQKAGTSQEKKNVITREGIEEIFGLRKSLYGSDSTWKDAIYKKLSNSTLYGKLDHEKVRDAFLLWRTADDRISFLKAFQGVLENAAALKMQRIYRGHAVRNKMAKEAERLVENEAPVSRNDQGYMPESYCYNSGAALEADRLARNEAAFNMQRNDQGDMHRSYSGDNYGQALEADRLARNEAAFNMQRNDQGDMHRSYSGDNYGQTLEVDRLARNEAAFNMQRNDQGDMRRSYSGDNYGQTLEADRLAAANNSTSIIGASSDGSVLSRGSSISRSSSSAVAPVTEADVANLLLVNGLANHRTIDISKGNIHKVVLKMNHHSTPLHDLESFLQARKSSGYNSSQTGKILVEYLNF